MPKTPQDESIDNLVAGFARELEKIVATARRATVDYLTTRLSVQDGVIARTKTNQGVLRNVAARFQREMKRAGYTQLVDAYVAEFNGQFEHFDTVLAKLGADIGRDLTVQFGKRDVDLFASQQLSTVHLLEDVVVNVAADAQRQALLSVGGLKLADLIDEVVVQFGKATGEATTIADTSTSIFYRTILDRGFQKVEASLPKSITARYKYTGPDDKVTRPFCRDLCVESAEGMTWTRAEIDEMDNDQIPNVFLSCGGHNCRHSWNLVMTIAAK